MYTPPSRTAAAAAAAAEAEVAPPRSSSYPSFSSSPLFFFPVAARYPRAAARTRAAFDCILEAVLISRIFRLCVKFRRPAAAVIVIGFVAYSFAVYTWLRVGTPDMLESLSFCLAVALPVSACVYFSCGFHELDVPGVGYSLNDSLDDLALYVEKERAARERAAGYFLAGPTGSLNNGSSGGSGGGYGACDSTDDRTPLLMDSGDGDSNVYGDEVVVETNNDRQFAEATEGGYPTWAGWGTPDDDSDAGALRMTRALEGATVRGGGGGGGGLSEAMAGDAPSDPSKIEEALAQDWNPVTL